MRHVMDDRSTAPLPETPLSLIAKAFPSRPTQAAVAEAAHVSLRTVGRWVGAKSCPGEKKITRIASACKTTAGVCVDAYQRQRVANQMFRLHSKMRSQSK